MEVQYEFNASGFYEDILSTLEPCEASLQAVIASSSSALARSQQRLTQLQRLHEATRTRSSTAGTMSMDGMGTRGTRPVVGFTAAPTPAPTPALSTVSVGAVSSVASSVASLGEEVEEEEMDSDSEVDAAQTGSMAIAIHAANPLENRRLTKSPVQEVQAPKLFRFISDVRQANGGQEDDNDGDDDDDSVGPEDPLSITIVPALTAETAPAKPFHFAGTPEPDDDAAPTDTADPVPPEDEGVDDGVYEGEEDPRGEFGTELKEIHPPREMQVFRERVAQHDTLDSMEMTVFRRPSAPAALERETVLEGRRALASQLKPAKREVVSQHPLRADFEQDNGFLYDDEEDDESKAEEVGGFEPEPAADEADLRATIRRSTSGEQTLDNPAYRTKYEQFYALLNRLDTFYDGLKADELAGSSTVNLG